MTSNVPIVTGASRGTSVTVAPGRVVNLSLTTWEALIASLIDALRQAGDTGTLSDVEQLHGLCRRMDDEGFLPLGADELSSGIWRRVAQMSAVIPDVIEALRDRGIAVAEGRLSHGQAWTGQKTLKMKGMNVGLYFDAASCGAWFPTPFWLSLPAAAQANLAGLSVTSPRRVFELRGAPYVALPIRTGVERPDVVSDVVDACAAIAALLPAPIVGAAGPAVMAPAAPQPTDDETDTA